MILIQVTDNDIKYGKRRHCTDCAIGLAGQRAFPNHKVSVSSPGYLKVVDENGKVKFYRLPPEAVNWDLKFDAGWTVQAFTFTVEEPQY